MTAANVDSDIIANILGIVVRGSAVVAGLEDSLAAKSIGHTASLSRRRLFRRESSL